MTPQFRTLGWALWLALLPVVALLPVGASLPRSASPAQDPPQVLFKDLFIAVQTAQIYSDGKAFPDAVPNAAPQDILRQYHAARPDSIAALKQFVAAHFALPSEATAAPSAPERVSIVAHIDSLWDTL